MKEQVPTRTNQTPLGYHPDIYRSQIPTRIRIVEFVALLIVLAMYAGELTRKLSHGGQPDNFYLGLIFVVTGLRSLLDLIYNWRNKPDRYFAFVMLPLSTLFLVYFWMFTP